MGMKEVKAAFEQELGPTYSCSMATMDIVRHDGVESQVLFFRGNDASGALFEIRSDPIRGDGDLIAAAQATAKRVLEKAGP